MAKMSRRLLDYLQIGKTSDQKYLNWKQKSSPRNRAKLDYYTRVADGLPKLWNMQSKPASDSASKNRFEIDTFRQRKNLGGSSKTLMQECSVIGMILGMPRSGSI